MSRGFACDHRRGGLRIFTIAWENFSCIDFARLLYSRCSLSPFIRAFIYKLFANASIREDESECGRNEDSDGCPIFGDLRKFFRGNGNMKIAKFKKKVHEFLRLLEKIKYFNI